VDEPNVCLRLPTIFTDTSAFGCFVFPLDPKRNTRGMEQTKNRARNHGSIVSGTHKYSEYSSATPSSFMAEENPFRAGEAGCPVPAPPIPTECKLCKGKGPRYNPRVKKEVKEVFFLKLLSFVNLGTLLTN
jgi:hypothetical protein